MECIGKYSDLNHSIIERLAILSRLFPGIFNLKLCDTLKSHLDETFKRSVEQVNAGKTVDELIKMSAAICEVIPLIQHAGQNVDVFKNLVGTVVKAEQDLGFALVKIHPHLVTFCQTLISYQIRNFLDVFLEGQKLANQDWSALLMHLIRCENSEKLRGALEKEAPNLIKRGLSQPVQETYANPVQADIQFTVIELMYVLASQRPSFLRNQHLLMDSLKKIWTSSAFKNRYQMIPTGPTTSRRLSKPETSRSDTPGSDQDFELWSIAKYSEPVLIAKIFLIYVQTVPNDYEFLFQLQRIHQIRTLSQFGLVKFWFKNEMVEFYSLEQQRNIILRLMKTWNSKKNYDESLKASLIYNIIMPILNYQKENGNLKDLIGPFCLEGEIDLVGQMIENIVEADSGSVLEI